MATSDQKIDGRKMARRHCQRNCTTDGLLVKLKIAQAIPAVKRDFLDRHFCWTAESNDCVNSCDRTGAVTAGELAASSAAILPGFFQVGIGGGQEPVICHRPPHGEMVQALKGVVWQAE